jgi:DNA-binding transcriptional regulator PaaX
MSKLENELRVEVRRTKINKAVLATILGAGILAMAVVAPNTLSLLGSIGPRNRKFRAEKTLTRLINKGYVSITTKNGQKHVSLTSKGELLAHSMDEGRIHLKPQKSWDGKWRMLIFDIPEKKRFVRDRIRNTLNSIGFVRLQDSVWVYPYDCEDLITLLKIDFKIGREMLYIIADKIENDIALRKNFGLN